MNQGGTESRAQLKKQCPKSLLSSYPELNPTFTNITKKSFKSAINFNEEVKEPTTRTFYRDLKSTHIRNRQLLDLPFKVPKCCHDIYNANVTRQREKKLQKFGLALPPKLPDCTGKIEEDVEMIPRKEKVITEQVNVTYFPECYLLQDSGSEDERSEEYTTCSSGSESECSACSLLGGGTRRRMHRVVRKDWRELLHTPDDPCKGVMEKEIQKHKSKEFFNMKVKKLLNN